MTRPSARAVRRRLGDVAAGLLVDRLLCEPPTALHPVAWFGTAMTRLERACWADDRARGAFYTAAGLVLGVSPVLLGVPTGPALALTAAGRSLRGTAREVEQRLLAGDLDGARALLPALVGRDPSTLDEAGVCAAVVESLAENTVDAVVAPALWALALGAPGTLALRASNTMDAMVGHRSVRHERFGWASARLDDVACWVPARATAALVALVRPRRAAVVLRVVRRDAGPHPSPNAGVAESAVAAALGVELGGPLRYGERREDRPRLGDGPRPGPADVARARALVDDAERALVALLLLGVALALLPAHRPPHRSAR